VLYNYKVIYSVKTQNIYNHYYKLCNMFRFTEPFSGQFLLQSKGTMVRICWIYFVLRIGLNIVQ